MQHYNERLKTIKARLSSISLSNSPLEGHPVDFPMAESSLEPLQRIATRVSGDPPDLYEAVFQGTISNIRFFVVYSRLESEWIVRLGYRGEKPDATT